MPLSRIFVPSRILDNSHLHTLRFVKQLVGHSTLIGPISRHPSHVLPLYYPLCTRRFPPLARGLAAFDEFAISRLVVVQLGRALSLSRVTRNENCKSIKPKLSRPEIFLPAPDIVYVVEIYASVKIRICSRKKKLCPPVLKSIASACF